MAELEGKNVNPTNKIETPKLEPLNINEVAKPNEHVLTEKDNVNPKQETIKAEKLNVNINETPEDKPKLESSTVNDPPKEVGKLDAKSLYPSRVKKNPPLDRVNVNDDSLILQSKSIVNQNVNDAAPTKENQSDLGNVNQVTN